MVPFNALVSGTLNMSYVSWPVLSQETQPARSQRMTWKSSSPTSCVGYESTPPPVSGSPFVGKSSSKTYTVTVEVRSGFGSALTVTLVGKVQVRVVPVMVQAGATEAPPMVCPHVDEVVKPVGSVCPELGVQLPAPSGSWVLPKLNGLAASPGRTERK